MDLPCLEETYHGVCPYSKTLRRMAVGPHLLSPVWMLQHCPSGRGNHALGKWTMKDPPLNRMKKGPFWGGRSQVVQCPLHSPPFRVNAGTSPKRRLIGIVWSLWSWLWCLFEVASQICGSLLLTVLKHVAECLAKSALLFLLTLQMSSYFVYLQISFWAF